MTEATLQTRHPTLEQVICLAMESLSESLRVCLPGQIQSYDASKGLAVVQPNLLVRYRGRGQPEPLPAIGQVPVVMPRTAAGGIIFPLAAGDPVLLIFADRSIANWVQGDGSAKPPALSHKHDLTDCFAIPGGYPQTKPLKAQFPKALEIHLNNQTPFAVSNGQDELLKILNDMLTYLCTTVTFSNGGGPTGPPTNASQLQQIQQRLQKFLAQ